MSASGPSSSNYLLGLQRFTAAESARRVRAIEFMAKAFPISSSDPFGVKRLERSRAKTPAGYKRLFDKIMREQGLGEPTRKELRKMRAEIRNEEPKLKLKEVYRNAYRHPQVRERCPRNMPKRRAPGWAAANFILPRRTIEGLTFLTKRLADRERAERSNEPYGFRRRYPRTRNFYVVQALNYLFEENRLHQFCVQEAPVALGRVRRFAAASD